MRSRFPNPAAPRPWSGPRSPIPYPARARSWSRSWRAPSTAPTCSSGRASTTRRPAPRRTPAWSARAGSPRSARASSRLGRRRRGVRAAGRRRLRREGRRAGGAAAARAGGHRPGDGRGAARGDLHRLVERLHDRPSAPRRDRCWCTAARSGIGTMAIQLAKAVGARVAVTAGSAGEAGALRGAGCGHPDQLPRAGLRRGAARRPRTGRARTSSSTSSARSTWTGTSGRWPSTAVSPSSACRAASRAS